MKTQAKLPLKEGEAFIGIFFKTEKKARAYAKKNKKRAILKTSSGNCIVI